MTASPILHETRSRLRVAARRGDDLAQRKLRLQAVPGVASVRASTALHCLVVAHDGQPATRAAVLARLQEDVPAPPLPRARGVLRPAPADAVPLVLAAVAPLVPPPLRRALALAAIATRVLVHPKRLRRNTRGVLFDATSLAALAISGQEVAASTSLLLRALAEQWSARLVRQADELLSQLLPTEAARYRVSRTQNGDGTRAAWLPLHALRAGDRVHLAAGDVVPADGCVVEGEGWLVSALRTGDEHRVEPGEHVVAGERLQRGGVLLLAEADPADSRLERLRAQVRHVIGTRDPAGLLQPGAERYASLPLTAAALVLGFTGDTARAATMLQADPKQGLDLALPLAREAVLGALARHGLLASGLEAVDRLALARTLVLQDMGVLASGRWQVEGITPAPGMEADRVRRWLATLAGVPVAALDRASLSDRQVREWVRHGALLRADGRDVQLASRARLRAIWGLDETAPAFARSNGEALRRRLALVSDGQVLAWVQLASPWRDAAHARLAGLHGLGFKRIAVVAEDANHLEPQPVPEAGPRWRVQLGSDARERREWLANAARNGRPLVMVHTVLRDLLPAGSVGLTPLDADTGSHGVLLGDPLQVLLTARALARKVHRHLMRQQQAAAALDAALITGSALRWLPPIATALVHHGFTLLLLVDSMRLAALAPNSSQPPEGVKDLASASRVP